MLTEDERMIAGFRSRNVPREVTWRHRAASWNPDLEKLFQDAVAEQVSLDDWDSTSQGERNLWRSFWYAGYITGCAGNGSY
jgi:hypothetical protein